MKLPLPPLIVTIYRHIYPLHSVKTLVASAMLLSTDTVVPEGDFKICVISTSPIQMYQLGLGPATLDRKAVDHSSLT